MIPDPLLLLLLGLFGGCVAMDGTTFGQFMFSRPFVAATLAGWIVGAPAAGAVVGVVLEAFHLAVLPVGAAKFPEGGPPAVVAGAAFGMTDPGPVPLLTAVVFALGWELLAGETVKWQRQMNVRLFSARIHAFRTPDELERRHHAALALDFLRGAILVVAGLLLLQLLLWLVGTGSLWSDRVAQIAIGASVAGLLASASRLFPERGRLFLAGAAGGIILLLVRG